MAEDRMRRADGAGREVVERARRESWRALRAERALRDQLACELEAAREELSACRLEAERLRQELADLEREHQRFLGCHAALERELAELRYHSVVMERLHGALDHRDALAAIQDVVVNVIGSEELAVFEPTEDGRSLRITWSFGVSERGLGTVPLGVSVIGRAAAESRGWVVGDGAPPPEFPDLTACVPLRAGAAVAGVLAIWRMLPHKPAFGESDRGLLETVARHAAVALYLTSRDERRPRGAAEAPGTSP